MGNKKKISKADTIALVTALIYLLAAILEVASKVM